MENFGVIFGYLAVILTVSSFVPQVWRSIQTKSLNDLSIWTLIIFVCSSSSWLIYGLIIIDFPIIITNTVVFSLQMTLLVLKIKHGPSGKVSPQIEHVALWVSDLEGMASFYEQYFQASRGNKYQNPAKNFTSYFLAFKHQTCRMELMHNPEFLPPSEGDEKRLGLAHMAFSVGSQEQVDALTEQFRTDGYPIIGEPRVTGDGYYESLIADPEGNLIEITV